MVRIRVRGKRMSKYIIKNCPCYRDREVDYTCTIEAISSDCHNCTDCVMKQIVKKCRKSLEVSYCPIEQEILELLDIQEDE